MRTIAALALASVLSTTHLAAAATTRRWVAVVVTPEARVLARRLQQEIEARGLSVQVLGTDEAIGTQPLSGASAVIHLEATGTEGVELRIADQRTGKSDSWRIAASPEGTGGGTELLATRTVELLRARLLEL